MSKDSILLPLACVLGVLFVSAPASAQTWKIEQGESISLEYRNAADTESMLSVSCGARHSDIVIPLAPGTKPPAQAPELRVKERAGVYPMTMQWDVCGGELTCTDRPAGDVSTYYVKSANKQTALRFATRALALDIEAPGVKLSASADRHVFARFAALCRKQR